MRNKTAAAIVIGNEILSGKIVDSNSSFLARELRVLGVSLERILVIPDDVDVIAAAVREMSPQFDVVFTSGGVGPTHDDITMAGIAHGLGRPMVHHPALLEKIEAFVGADLTEPQRKMAEVPEGAEAIFDGHAVFPSVRVENIFILPGIPELFREKFLAIRARFAVDPYYMSVVYLQAQESAIAGHLDATLGAFPELMLGSYPRLGDPEYKVRVTLESKDEEYLKRAFEDLLGRLSPDMIVRTD